MGSGLMPGPEVQANAIWTALHGLPLRSAPLPVDLVLVALMALLPLGLRLRLGVLVAGLAALAAGLVYLVAAQLAFDAGWVLAVAAPLAALAVAAVGMVVTSYLAESRERRRVAGDNDVLEERVRERTEALEMTQLEVVHRLAAAVESRDLETGHHIERIGTLCERLALATGVDQAAAEMMRHAAALHDVGKIAIPDGILLKPATLDPDEWEMMKTHTTEGARILAGSASELVRLGETIARTHHERWDGSGYPAGLAGEEIPLAGRICAVCDSYDAMTSHRPYKEAMTPEEALAELERHAGSQFDPWLVTAFCAMRRELLAASVPAEWALSPSAAEGHRYPVTGGKPSNSDSHSIQSG
jgi:response regulator RpfG family c-di-GMP phosphodiesterase